MKYLGTIEVDGVDFECYGEYEQADRSVGYNGYVDIEDVRFNDKSFLDIIKPSVLTYIEDELHYKLN